ncbi:hypothetical protein R6Q59_007555 [Mikania micrantha]
MIPKIRRGTAEEKTAKSDPIYRNRLVNMLVNRILKHGKKSLAYQIIYRAVKKIQQKTETNPLSVLHQAIHGVTSGIAVKARRVGGSNDCRCLFTIIVMEKIPIQFKWIQNDVTA